MSSGNESAPRCRVKSVIAAVRLRTIGSSWTLSCGSPEREPWRDLPESFGNWNSNWGGFRRWAVKGVFDLLFERLSGDRDFEYAMIDGTIVRVHQQGTGARGGLIVKRSDGRAVARPARSWRWWMRWETWRVLFCCLGKATISSA